MVLYVVFVKLYQRLERVMKPGVAAVLTLTVALIIIALPLTWLIGVVIAQAPDALRRLQSSTVFTGQVAVAVTADSATKRELVRRAMTSARPCSRVVASWGMGPVSSGRTEAPREANSAEPCPVCSA